MAFFRKFPIYVHPFFWIFSALIGFLMSRTILGTFLWVIIIFISVLFHETGHALTAVFFKQNVKIELIAMGGLTSYRGKRLKYWQQFLIVLAGPVFGIILFGMATFILWLGVINPLLFTFVKSIQVVNLFWSVVNLLPVLPLDGGQLLRIALEGIWGVKGLKISFLIGFIISIMLALVLFTINFLLGALFFLFAFQSFDMYRKTKNITTFDRDESIANKFRQAERLLQKNQKQEAEEILEELRNKTQKGLIFVQTTLYLAFLNYEKQEYKKAYEYLLSVQDKLNEEGIRLLHKLAFQEKNYELVKKLSSNCYKAAPTQEVALINAKTFAILNEKKLAGGWLKTAKQFGNLDIEKILVEPFFKKIKDSPEFKKFIH